MPKRLAEIVIDTGLASRDEVLRIVKLAEQRKMPLVAALVREGGVDELALVAAVRRQIRASLVDPGQIHQDPEAMRELPREVCWRLKVMPLSLANFDESHKVLSLAMADPTDALAIAEVEHITGCQVEPSLMPLSAVEELVETGYRSQITAVFPRKRVIYSAPAAREPAAPSRTDKEKPTSAPDFLVSQPQLPTEDAKASGSSVVRTVPFHRVTSEASLELRHQALLALLVKKNLLSEEEYTEQVRELMKQRNEDG